LGRIPIVVPAHEGVLVFKSRGRRMVACGLLAAGLLTAARTAALGEDRSQLGPNETTGPALSLDQLARMSWPELERLYRQSEAGTIPEGYAEGKAIYCPCGRFAGMRSRLTGVVWRGKVFDAADGTLVNQWCGFRAIRAQVSYGPSWLDGAPSIVMDYSATSKVWTDVRDEVREVAPRLYLGRMYRRKAGAPEFQIFFALQTCPR
jgi:hypothetical protein